MSAPGGKITKRGDRALADRLERALTSVAPDDLPLTHGVHAYPARFPPALVAALLEGWPAGTRLLDPFVGSGTTLVEGLVRGFFVQGVDASPLAVAISRLKTTVWPTERIAAMFELATGVAARSLERVKRRARTRTSGEELDDPKRFQPHVFRELVGLWEEIQAEPDERMRSVLLLVLSSILVKVSRRRGETAAGAVDKAIGKGLATKLFLRRADELGRRLTALAAAVPAGTKPADVRLGDARHLRHIASGTVDVVVTSPPYFGTYDYRDVAEARVGWLGLAAPREPREIGARSVAARGPGAEAAWQRDVGAYVGELARVLKPGGFAYVVTGDSSVGRRVIAGDLLLRGAAGSAGLEVRAHTQQARPQFHGPAQRQAPERHEHILALTRVKP